MEIGKTRAVDLIESLVRELAAPHTNRGRRCGRRGVGGAGRDSRRIYSEGGGRWGFLARGCCSGDQTSKMECG